MNSRYKTPLRSRKAIADYLDSVGGYYSDHNGSSYFAFDVKCRRVDLSFENLIKLYRDSGEYDTKNECYLDNPEWLEKAKELYKYRKDVLFDYAIDAARMVFTDYDDYRQLEDGTSLKVNYTFMGRSGGHLGIESFEGFNFTMNDREGWKHVLRGNPYRKGTEEHEDWEYHYTAMDFVTLRKLYALMVMLVTDLTPKRINDEVEVQAAIAFVEVICEEIPQYDKIQQTLFN